MRTEVELASKVFLERVPFTKAGESGVLMVRVSMLCWEENIIVMMMMTAKLYNIENIFKVNKYDNNDKKMTIIIIKIIMTIIISLEMLMAKFIKILTFLSLKTSKR